MTFFLRVFAMVALAGALAQVQASARPSASAWSGVVTYVVDGDGRRAAANRSAFVSMA